MTNTALQVTNFNFYGDDLIAVRDNANGEVYTPINNILKNIGFINKDQIRKRRDKMVNDIVISKGIQIFILPTQQVVAKNDTTLFDKKETYCISNRKLPLALAKINITPKMKQTQPELASKLELYQDKCADVLSSVFIDHKTTDQINSEMLSNMIAQAITTSMTSVLQPLCDDIQSLKEQQQSIQKQLPKKRFSSWTSKMFPKYQLLMDYFDIGRKELYHNLYIELQNTYPDIDLSQEHDDYCFENELDSCFTLDVIEHNRNLRILFTSVVDNLLEKYNLVAQSELIRRATIFD